MRPMKNVARHLSSYFCIVGDDIPRMVMLSGSVAVFVCSLHLQGSGRRKDSTGMVNTMHMSMMMPEMERVLQISKDIGRQNLVLLSLF